MRTANLFLVLLFCIVPAGISQEFKQAPHSEELEGCVEPSGRRVPTIEDYRQPFVVEARFDRERGGTVIAVNHDLAAKFSLSPYTIRWLYLRECAHLCHRHEPLSLPSAAAQADADCIAVNELLAEHSDEEYMANKIAKTVQRDIMRLDLDAWKSMRLGEQRDPDLLFRCFEK